MGMTLIFFGNGVYIRHKKKKLRRLVLLLNFIISKIISALMIYSVIMLNTVKITHHAYVKETVEIKERVE